MLQTKNKEETRKEGGETGKLVGSRWVDNPYSLHFHNIHCHSISYLLPSFMSNAQYILKVLYTCANVGFWEQKR